MLGWLLPGEAAAFERHLADCPDCRRQCVLQKSIDGLLAEYGTLSDGNCSGLIERAGRQARTAWRQKAVRLALAIAAAAAVLTAAVFGRFALRSSAKPGGQDIAAAQNTAAESGKEASDSIPSRLENPQTSTLVALADPSKGIVLECKTNNPNINLVWIYPTVNTDAMPAGQSDE